MILLDELLKKDTRFSLDAYMLINDGLQHAYRLTGKKEHITARELLESIRQLMRERYGQMAKMVLNSWGIFTTDDIGQVIFNLIDAGLFLKDKIDRIEEFHALYDFDCTFVQDYEIPVLPPGSNRKRLKEGRG